VSEDESYAEVGADLDRPSDAIEGALEVEHLSLAGCFTFSSDQE